MRMALTLSLPRGNTLLANKGLLCLPSANTEGTLIGKCSYRTLIVILDLDKQAAAACTASATHVSTSKPSKLTVQGISGEAIVWM